MLFNSFAFLIFFPVVVSLYFILPQKWRWLWLLFTSCYFYMAFVPYYILILAVTIVVDYFAGILIEKSEGARRKQFLILSIVCNVGFLAFFKYYNFGIENLDALLKFLHWNYSLPVLKILLPIGLSFHTFQAMAYTIEVYRGNQKAERHFGIYALYVMFFPQLVAGPIERPQNLIGQFYQEHKFEYQRVASGLKLMAWGMFKKIVIADRLAIVANTVFGNLHYHEGLSLIIASLAFGWQIYCDFSGYSDIARGAAEVLGFKLMRNFSRPYFSKSVSEFWRRWHISLSTWFKDYVYIPLGGSRVSKWRHSFNLVVVFLLSGLWHGANWTYVVWGAFHGIVLVLSLWSDGLRQKLAHIFKLTTFPKFHSYLKMFITYLLINLSWIFFRAGSLQDCFYIITHMFSGLGEQLSKNGLTLVLQRLGLGYQMEVVAVLSVLLLVFVELKERHGDIGDWISKRPLWFRWAVYYALIIGTILFGAYNSSQFIYFQF